MPLSCSCYPPVEEEESEIFNLFMIRVDGLSPIQFQAVYMNDSPIVEVSLQLKIPLYDIDIEEGKFIGEFDWRNLQEDQSTVRMLRFNSHLRYSSNINAVSQSFRCPNCDTFFKKTYVLERNITTCSERVYPRNLYQIREILFHKLESFGNK